MSSVCRVPVAYAGRRTPNANGADGVAYRLKPTEFYRGERITELFDNAITTSQTEHLALRITKETGFPGIYDDPITILIGCTNWIAYP